MKTHLAVLRFVVIGLIFATSRAQGDPRVFRSGLPFSGYIAKLWSDFPGFTANFESHWYPGNAENGITTQGKLEFLSGEYRFEMDVPPGNDPNPPPVDGLILKQMGMDRMITISCPDKMVNYFIYPAIKAYVPSAISAAALGDYNIDAAFASYENVLGQNCVKNIVTATGPDGVTHTLTVWNATDLNNFPIKIESDEGGSTSVMLFKDLSLAQPDASRFYPPADYTKFNDFKSLWATRASALGAR